MTFRPNIRIGFFLLVTVMMLLTGCSIIISDSALEGKVFTYIKVPLTRDLNNTPVGDSSGSGMVIRITEPFTDYNFYTEFNSNAVGDIAKHHGIKTVYFADLEIFDVLGVWTHRKLYIYGIKEQEP